MVDDPKDPRNRASPITPTFEANAKGVQKSPEPKGSDMVKRDQPAPAPRPPGDMRAGPDRQSYNERLAAEGDKSRKAVDPQKAADLARSIQARKGKDREKDRDQEK